MIRLTGTLLFSLMCMMPLGVEGKVGDPICPKDKIWCPNYGQCRDDCSRNVILLKKMPSTIYSLEEGAIVTCEAGKTLVPVPGTETHWTCGTAKESSKKK